MRENNPSWYIRWNDELPSPEELIPISQSLITSHLARAFQIGIPNHLGSNKNTEIFHQKLQSATPTTINSDFGADSTDLGSGSVGAGDEPARTLKRPRLVWTPQLHKRFVDAVGHLGIKNAVPKTIMQMMSVDGLTRENVASHLQKYRLYLRRMQGISNGNGNEISRSNGQVVVVSDTATDRLFASSPVPAHFLSSEYFMPPLMPMKYQQDQRQDQKYAHSQQRQFEFESGNGNGGRKILTLFPTGNG